MFLRLFAPFIPFATEEVWSWWKEGSIHTAAWPTRSELAVDGDPAVLAAVSTALVEIRGAKSQAKVSMRAELSRVEVVGSEAQLAAVRMAAQDLCKVGKITGDLVFTLADDATEISVLTELAPTD